MINGLEINGEEFNDKTNNCYTYAMNQPVNNFTNQDRYSRTDCQPGELNGHHKMFLVTYDFRNMKEAVKSDLDTLGYDIVESYFEEVIDIEGSWKVALCRRTEECDPFRGPDYHWYRQNLDGTWSHKLGFSSNVSNLDNSGEIITDPEECDRESYDVFMGYYMIIPKDACVEEEPVVA